MVSPSLVWESIRPLLFYTCWEPIRQHLLNHLFYFPVPAFPPLYHEVIEIICTGLWTGQCLLFLWEPIVIVAHITLNFTITITLKYKRKWTKFSIQIWLLHFDQFQKLLEPVVPLNLDNIFSDDSNSSGSDLQLPEDANFNTAFLPSTHQWTSLNNSEIIKWFGM